MTRFSLKWLFVGVAVVGIAIASLMNANDWWVTCLRSVYCSLIVAAAMCSVWCRNAFCLGAVIVALCRAIISFAFLTPDGFLSDKVIEVIVAHFFQPSHWGNDEADLDYWRAVNGLLTIFWSMLICVVGGLCASRISRWNEQREAKP